MTAREAPTEAPSSIIETLPIALFGSVMGLTGLSIAWHLAQARYHAPGEISGTISALAVATFIVLVIGYGAKVVVVPRAVVAEFRHPIAGNLFGTVFISLLLLPIMLAPYALLAAEVLWVIGAVGMALFAWVIVGRWMRNRQLVTHATPAWVVPVVGMLDVPLALPSLALPPLHGVMVFGLAIGLFFAVPLFTLIFFRLLFEEPIPPALEPSLFILVAPFAVGFSAYAVTSGQIDLFAESLYALTLFLLAVLLGRLRHALSCCPFRVSWWSISFPLAAAAIAGVRFAIARPGLVADALALLLLTLASTAIAALLVRTLWGVARGELRALAD